MQQSNYADAATRPFGAFFEDLTDDQRWQNDLTMSMLYAADDQIDLPGGIWPYLDLLKGLFGNGYKTHTKFNEQVDEGSLYPSRRDYENRIAGWWDNKKGVVCVLEWNRVQGIRVREYRLVVFLRKAMAEYRTYAINDEPLVPEDVAPFVTRLFPKWDDLKVEVWDKPSDMYLLDEMKHINSCMVGMDYTKFYDCGPVKGVVVRQGTKVVSRTLMWTLDDGRKTLDRIYDNSGIGQIALRDWANDNDVLIRPPDDGQVTMKVHTLGYPYIDNFANAVRHNGNVVLFTSSSNANEYIEKNDDAYGCVYDLWCTAGGPSSLRRELVEHNGKWVSTEDLVTFNGVVHYINDYPTAVPHILMANTDPTAIFRYWNDMDNVTLDYAANLYAYNGSVFRVKDDDVTVDGQRLPRTHVYETLSVGADGELIRAFDLPVHQFSYPSHTDLWDVSYDCGPTLRDQLHEAMADLNIPSSIIIRKEHKEAVVKAIIAAGNKQQEKMKGVQPRLYVNGLHTWRGRIGADYLITNNITHPTALTPGNLRWAFSYFRGIDIDYTVANVRRTQ